jgi:hypothetical protein
MPWTVSDVDSHKKGLTPAQKSKWVAIANGVLKQCQKDGGSDCEGKAIRIANSKFSEPSMENINDLIEADVILDEEGEDELLATKDTDKPGGSNAGKYKPSEGPFCGPSGGAPRGTYPVGTRKRAKAAIAYARNAPNPAGIKKCVCRHWPDLPSCAKRNKQGEEDIPLMTTKSVPVEALKFAGGAGSVEIEKKEGGAEKQLRIVAYSGGIIEKHWYWGNLAIDLGGLKFPKKSYPVLEEHDRTRKIAFIPKPEVKDNKLIAEDGTFVDTEASREFQALSASGFPYQASIYAIPTVIEQVSEKATVNVNGFTLKGPGSVWRQAEFKEVSVCVFGHDSNTESRAFTDVNGKLELSWENYVDETMATSYGTTTERKEVKRMTLEEMKKDDPEGHKALLAEAMEAAKVELQKQHDSEKSELKGQITALSTKVNDLEKKDAIREEKERIMSNEIGAKAIWSEKLAASELSIPAKNRLPKHLSFKDFLKDDGYLDTDAFAKAVEEEIKYWEKEVGATDKVMGTGALGKDVGQGGADKAKEEEEDRKWIEHMNKLASRGAVQNQA